MLQRLTPRFILKPDWGATDLSPWFPDAAGKTGPEKVGEVWFQSPVDHPLLIKFLFTTGKLSVQVHPGDEYARAHHHGSRGKTEMWHVLAAQPGAQIAAGLRETITEDRLQAAALSGEIENLLTWYDARAGDTFFLPAGTIHAIGPGFALCEVQQNSDLTYRLYDYGRPRELHLEHALRVSDLGPYDPRVDAREGVLVDCAFFRTERLRIEGDRTLSSDREQTVVLLDGALSIDGRSSAPGEVFRGQGPVDVAGSGTLLRIVTVGS